MQESLECLSQAAGGAAGKTVVHEKIWLTSEKRYNILGCASGAGVMRTCAVYPFSGVWLSLARAPGLGPGGRKFESCHPDVCRCSSMVEHQPSKLDTWVRFPSPALICASGSGVEYDLAKVGVAGSNPVSRSLRKPRGNAVF